MKIHICQFFLDKILPNMSLKNRKVEMINPLQNKPNTAKTKKKL